MGSSGERQRQQAFIAETKSSMNAKNGYNFRGNTGREPGIKDTKGKR